MVLSREKEGRVLVNGERLVFGLVVLGLKGREASSRGRVVVSSYVWISPQSQ